MQTAHRPAGNSDISPRAKFRERLAYDEIFAHQLTLALARANIKRARGLPSVATGKLQSKILKSLPYKPTSAQQNAIAEIADDLAAPVRMSRRAAVA